MKRFIIVIICVILTCTAFAGNKKKKRFLFTKCTWTITQATFFIPAGVGPCSNSLFGVEVHGNCAGGNVGCDPATVDYTLMEYNGVCGQTLAWYSGCVSSNLYSASCGANFRAYDCFSPYSSWGFTPGNYKLTIKYYSGSGCSGTVLIQKDVYLNFFGGYWSVIANPCP